LLKAVILPDEDGVVADTCGDSDEYCIGVVIKLDVLASVSSSPVPVPTSGCPLRSGWGGREISNGFING